MNYIYYALALLILARMIFLIVKRSKFMLHILQLEEYDMDKYKKTLNKNSEIIFSSKVIDITASKALVFTNRAKRLYIANLIISITLLLLSVIPFILTVKFLYIIFLLLASFFIYRQQPYIILFSNFLLSPFEKNIDNNSYVKAQEKIEGLKDLKVIGITGSFGKTGTASIVETILKRKHKVFNASESQNTSLGLSEIINKDLDSSIEVFIAEMGSKKIEDVEESSKLCSPRIGIITSIGFANMEVFNSIDNMMKSKYELIEALPADGVAIFNYDNIHIRKLADKTFKEKFLYGLDNIEDLDIYADNIVVSELGSRFTIKAKEGNSQECTSKLLGKHNISNILAGVCAARALGLSFEEIGKAISNIEPIAHKLNIINLENGIITIDNSLNSNPIGARAALEVLGEFKEGKKIIVTPGILEFGEAEELVNKEFGINAGKVCDYVILLGEDRTENIYKGLIEVNFNPENIFREDTLKKVWARIEKIAKAKDVVLFENDLPENQ